MHGQATMATGAHRIIPTERVDQALLRQWLLMGSGSLPGHFLRLHGVNPHSLVRQGLLRAGAGRWSDAYVAGPQLRH
jgi:hypothetical protein